MNIQVNVEQKIARPIDVVFKAVVDPEQMTQYFISKASSPLIADRIVTWTFADVGVELPIRVQTVKANELIAFEWPAIGQSTKVELYFEAVSETTTLVRATEKEWPMHPDGVTQAMQQTQGWTDMLLCLKAYLEFGINLRRGTALAISR